MKKKILLVFIAALAILLIVAGLSACQGRKEVTEIRVDNTEIKMSPYGEPSIYKLNVQVLPQTAKEQGFYFRYEDAADRQYLRISPDGTLEGKKIKSKTELDKNESPIEVPVPIYIYVHSKDNPKASVRVSVLIEEVAVKGISFKSKEYKIYLEEKSSLNKAQSIKPIYTPAHAVIGRDLTYIVDKPDVFEVDQETGEVRPLRVGASSVLAYTNVSGFDKRFECSAIVRVVYPGLHYKMNLDSPISSLRQIRGRKEKIEFSLVQTSAKTDPSPDVMWYINDTAINQEGAKNSMKLIYGLHELPAGEYVVKAMISNSYEDRELVSDKIRIYEPLEELRLGILNETITVIGNKAKAEKGDLLRIVVNRKTSEFPPEAYQWEITKPDGGIDYMQTMPKTQNEIGGVKVADLNYMIGQAGEYKIDVMPIVKGVPAEVKINTIELVASEESSGNDLMNIIVEGKKNEEGEYVPYITWKGLPYRHDEMAVEIKKGTGGEYSVKSLILSENTHMYDERQAGMLIPSDIAALDESFAVRIKGDRHGWSDWISYEPYLKSDEYRYFDNFHLDFNGYVSNVEDLAELLNELVIFRPLPEDLPAGMAEFSNAGNDFDGMLVYNLELFTPYVYDATEARFYPDAPTHYPDDGNLENMSKMISAAMNTYVETTNVKYAIQPVHVVSSSGEEEVLHNRYKVKIAFADIIENFDEKPANPTQKLESDLYSGSGSSIGDTLPVDLLSSTRKVRTSNQLYHALLCGYKPLPEIGSAAERTYAIARHVIKTNITKEMTQKDMMVAIYDFLASNVSYDRELASHNSTAADPINKYSGFQIEGALKAIFNANGEVESLVRGKAVCDGISKAASLMLSMLGIANARQMGSASGVGHVWNLALLDGRLHVFDATWAMRDFNKETAPGTFEKFEYVSHKYLLSSLEYAYGSSIDAYGKFEGMAASPSYAGYSWSISADGKYDKTMETLAELTYFVQSYMAPKVNGIDGKEIFVDIALDLSVENPEAGSLVFDLYQEKEDTANVTYEQYVNGNKQDVHVFLLICDLAEAISPNIEVALVSKSGNTPNDILQLSFKYKEP